MTFIELTKEELRDIIASVFEEQFAKHSQHNEPEKLLTKREAAALLKVTLPTLRTWEREGIIHPQRKGKRVDFLKSDLLNK